jgi:hypothetical protein
VRSARLLLAVVLVLIFTPASAQDLIFYGRR